MDKKERKIIFEKYNGRCAYCGCELTKGWHVSPLLPIKIKVTDVGMEEENNTVENHVPSCAGCNLSKMHLGSNGHVNNLTIDKFREGLQENFEFLQDSPYYKKAIKYGLITETKKPIIFYFESLINK